VSCRRESVCVCVCVCVCVHTSRSTDAGGGHSVRNLHIARRINIGSHMDKHMHLNKREREREREKGGREGGRGRDGGRKGGREREEVRVLASTQKRGEGFDFQRCAYAHLNVCVCRSAPRVYTSAKREGGSV
jgi:hypothetical protein